MNGGNGDCWQQNPRDYHGISVFTWFSNIFHRHWQAQKRTCVKLFHFLGIAKNSKKRLENTSVPRTTRGPTTWSLAMFAMLASAAPIPWPEDEKFVSWVVAGICLCKWIFMIFDHVTICHLMVVPSSKKSLDSTARYLFNLSQHGAKSEGRKGQHQWYPRCPTNLEQRCHDSRTNTIQPH